MNDEFDNKIPKKLQDKSDLCLSFLRDLARSSTVSGFIIGITKNVNTRRNAYLKLGFAGMFVIFDSMTCQQALGLEKVVYNDLNDENQNSILHRHWHEDKKNDTYRKSSGGLSQEGEEKIYSLYVVWSNP